MKTFIIKYHFGQYDSTQNQAEFVADARYTLSQVASIFSASMDCHALVITSIEAAN
jgi:hypothetical protein